MCKQFIVCHAISLKNKKLINASGKILRQRLCVFDALIAAVALSNLLALSACTAATLGILGQPVGRDGD